MPISSIIENGRYSAFQDLVDGYASSFAKVIVVSPNGQSTITARKAGRVSWFSGPRWLSQTNGLWWASLANRHELRKIDLVRTFGPRAGIIGRVLSKFSNSPHVSSADDLASNSWRDKSGLQAIVPGLVNRLGVLRADVLSATLDWEIEFLAETGYMSDLLLGPRGLPTDIYTPVSTTDPDRHPVVLWAASMTGDDSVSLVARVAASAKTVIPDAEFIVVAKGDAADQLRSASAEQELPITVVALEDVEPLVDLIERTWVCVTIPAPGQNVPHGLAMLALSAGIPLISLGDLGEDRGFQNHLNYIRVGRTESEEVVYDLQLLRRWTNFALRIGSAGQKLVEERYSTRSVGLAEGEQLARIAADLNVDLAMSDGARALEEFVARQSSGAEPHEEDGNGGDGELDSAPEAGDGAATGLDLVAAAIAAANGEPEPVDPAIDDDAVPSAATVGADLIAVLFDEDGISADGGGQSDRDETISEENVEHDLDPEMAIASEIGSADEDKGEDGLPQINVVKIDFDDISSAESAEEQADAVIDGPAPTENDDTGALGQDAISALFATGGEDDQPDAASGPAEPDPAEEAPAALGQDAISALFATGGEDDQPEAASGSAEPDPDEEAPAALGQDAISALFATDGENDQPEAASGPAETDPDEEAPAALDQDAISALFATGGADDQAA